MKTLTIEVDKILKIRGDEFMKKIAFVFYTNQLMNVSYLGGLPTTTSLENDLREALAEHYKITFQWEQALKEKDLDAIVIPDPFPPVLNTDKIPEIKIPAILFLDKKIAKIKDELDRYFMK